MYEYIYMYVYVNVRIYVCMHVYVHVCVCIGIVCWVHVPWTHLTCQPLIYNLFKDLLDELSFPQYEMLSAYSRPPLATRTGVLNPNLYLGHFDLRILFPEDE